MAVALTLAVPICAQAAGALREVRDPVTGEMRGPTAAEAAAFEKAEAQLRAAARSNSRQAARPTGQEITHPDGSVEMPLDDDTMMYSVATVGADGSMRMHCLPAQQARSLTSKSSKKASAVKVTTKVERQ